MTTLQDAINTADQDQYLAVVSTLRADQTIQSSVVNAGILLIRSRVSTLSVSLHRQDEAGQPSCFDLSCASPFGLAGNGWPSKAGPS